MGTRLAAIAIAINRMPTWWLLVAAAAMLGVLTLMGCEAQLDLPLVPPPFDSATPNLSATVYLLRDADFDFWYAQCNVVNHVNLPSAMAGAFTCFNGDRPQYIALRQSQCRFAWQMQTGICWEFANINPEFGGRGWMDGKNGAYK